MCARFAPQDAAGNPLEHRRTYQRGAGADPGDFSLAPPYPFVQLATLKQRTEKAARTAGRAPAGSQAHRLVPLSDHHYVSQLQMMVATLKIPLERRNKRTGRMEKARIWEITDRTVRTWL